MNYEKLIDGLDLIGARTQVVWRDILGDIEDAGYEVRKAGTPVAPEDIRKGDRYRMEWDTKPSNLLITDESQESAVMTQEGISDGRNHMYRFKGSKHRWYLLERVGLTLPTEPGVRFRAVQNGSPPTPQVYVTLSSGDIWTGTGVWFRENFEDRYTVTEVLS